MENRSSNELKRIVEDTGTVVIPDHGKYSTHYKIACPLASGRDAKIELLMRSYHPAGYGTRVERKAHCPRTGLYWAIVYRSNSCD